MVDTAAPPPHILDGVLPAERLLFASDLVVLGTFHVRPGESGFHGGQPCSGHTVVFPRRATWIAHDGGAPFVADPTLVPLYNRGQVYSRAAIDPRGDECEWMAFPADVLTGVLRELDQPRQDTPEAPFATLAVASSGDIHAAQRLLFAAARRSGADAGQIEEGAMHLLDLVLRRYVGAPRRARRPLEQIEETKRLLNLEGPTPLSLTTLAARCGLSPYRLCREFRRATGMTITYYRTRLRLCRALDALPHARDLSDLALASGFCSHSHFGSAFRREFHVTPSALRGVLTAPPAGAAQPFLRE